MQKDGREGTGDEIAASALAQTMAPTSDAPQSAPPRSDHGEPYLIESEKGRGGLGRVMRAYDRRLGRPVALKELHATTADAQARFLREARLTARLQHPSIVPIYEMGRRADGTPYYAMKLIDGDPFDVVLARARRLDERLAYVPNVLAVVEAMAYAHESGIIHRDLKPSNIVLGAFGETMVIDWGLAKDLREGAVVSSEEGRGDPMQSGIARRLAMAAPETALEATLLALGAEASSSSSSDGAVMGTLGYMPPEQFGGGAVGPRSDVFALGAVLYHTLTGAGPYEGLSLHELAVRIAGAAPIPIETREAEVPVELAAIARKAMAPAPEDRYASAKELAVDLKRFLDGKLVSAHDYSRRALALRWLAKHRRAVAAAGIFALTLAIVGVVSVWRIVAERNRAEVARGVAEEQRAIASRERGRAQAESQAMILVQARTAIERDPTEAVAWLKRYAREGADAALVPGIAADAERRGVARHVLRHTGPVGVFAMSADRRIVASAGDRSTIRLWSVADGRLLRTIADTGHVNDIALAPDGRFFIAACEIGGTLVFDLALGAERRLPDAKDFVQAFAVAPDSRAAIVVTTDRAVREWDLAAMTVRTIATLRTLAKDVAVSPDGRAIYLLGESLRIVDRATGALVERPTEHGIELAHPVFAKDGRLFAAAGTDHVIRVWDTRTFAMTKLAGHTADVQSLAFAPNGASLVSTSVDRTVRVWSLATRESQVFVGHTDVVESAEFSPDGARVVSAGEDATVRIWDLATGDARILRGHTMIIKWASFLPDGDAIVSASHDGTVRVWDAREDHDVTLRGHPNDIRTIAYSRDGRLLATAGQDHTVRLWDPSGGARTILRGHTEPVTGLAFLGDGAAIASASNDQTVRVWRDGEARVFPHDNVILSIAADTDGDRIVTVSAGGVVRIWDVASGRPLTLATNGQVQSASISARGDRVATAGDDGAVYVWSATDGALLHTLRGHPGAVLDVELAPSGDLLATSGVNGEARLWDVRTGALRAALPGASGRVARLAFTRDARLLGAAAGSTVYLWDVARGELAHALRGHDLAIRSLDFSPDGTLVVSASNDRTVRVWDTKAGALRALHRAGATVTRAAFSPDGAHVAAGGWDKKVHVWLVDSAAFVPSDPARINAWLDAITTADISPASPLETPQR